MSGWGDLHFAWQPAGPGGSASYDRITGTTATESLFEEGVLVTQSGVIGREYSGPVGSRFQVGEFSLAPPQDWTMMAVLSLDFGNNVAALWAGRGSAPNEYALVSGAEVGIRPGTASWPIVNVSPGAGIATVIARFTATGATTGTLEAFLGSSTAVGSENYSSANPLRVDRITVGRTDDSTPGNSSGLRVFGAAIWLRALTTTELDEVLADPLRYQRETATNRILRNRRLSVRSLRGNC